MSIVRAWFARTRATFGGDPGHLDEEIKQHVELLSADYVRRGFTAAEARYAALREFGNLTFLQQEYREQKGLPLPRKSLARPNVCSTNPASKSGVYYLLHSNVCGWSWLYDHGALRRVGASVEAATLSKSGPSGCHQRDGPAWRIVDLFLNPICWMSRNVPGRSRQLAHFGAALRR